MPHPSRDSKAVILLSGGLDSATTLYFAKKYGYKPYALIFDYNQRHRRELDAAIKLSKLNHIPYYIAKISLPWARSSLTQPKIKVPFNRDVTQRGMPNTYVAGRNIIFLSYGASFAESIGAKKIFIGANTRDYSGYPDCRPDFLRSMEMAVNLGISHKGIHIVTPLIDKTKREIVSLGLQLGVPFELTWSCYLGGKQPCGRCDSCRFRMHAFQELGIQDPLLACGDRFPARQIDPGRRVKTGPKTQ